MKTTGITIGKIKTSFFPKKEVLSDAQLNHHVHIVGASGYGKTVLLSHIIKDRIQNGHGLLYIDLKGDVETLRKYKKIIKEANREQDFELFSLTDIENSASYNLIHEGTATQLRDRIMMSFNWSEEFYKNQASSFLLKLMIGLCYLRDNKGQRLDLFKISECLQSTDEIVKLAALVPENEMRIRKFFHECCNFLEDKENFRSLQGLRVQIESLVLSDFGTILQERENNIGLFEATKSSKIIFVFLDTRRYGDTAKSVGKFILQDLKSASAQVDAEISVENRKPFSIIIDEFADLAQDDFIGFLDRARSSKMSVIVAHQEICDLERISPEFAGRLIGNTSTLYAFLQKRPESAELISGIAGTKTVWKNTRQTQRFLFFDIDSGNGTRRETEEFCVHPNIIKNLGVGRCVCIKKYPRAISHVVDILRGY